MTVYVWADVYETDGGHHPPNNPNENVFTECVLREDFDALVARLAEAERLLRLWFEYREPDDRLTAYSAKVEAFLRAADSAALSLSDYQCSSGRSAEDCMRWMSLSDGKAHCSRTDCTGPARISPVAKPDFWTIQD